MSRLLAVTAVGEAITGLVLLAYPPIVIKLLFGAEVAGIGAIVSRIAGISLIALGVACWPPRSSGAAAPALLGMLTYSTLAALYLAYLGIVGAWTGTLLWPAVAVHVILAILLARAWFGAIRHHSCKEADL